MIITSSWVYDALLFISTFMFIFYKYFNKNMNYWKERGVPYVKPKPFIGNFAKVLTLQQPLSLWLKDLHDSIDEPYFGIYLLNQPCLLVKSPEIIEQVFIKEFSKFTSRTVTPINHDEIIGEFMFMQRNPKWHTMRNNLAPIFSSGRLKSAFHIMNKIGENFVQHLSKYYLGDIEAKEPCSLYSLDVISQCAFGLDAGLLQKPEKPQFWKRASEPFQFKLSTVFPQFMGLFAPRLLDFFKINVVSAEFREYFVEIFLNAVRAREQEDMNRNDMIDIIIDLKNKDKLSGELDFRGRKIASPALQFLLAGFETTATSLSFLLYELAVNPEIQEKLRLEILNSYQESEKLTYDGINKLKYLDMCVCESLRKYPILPYLDRLCYEDYQVPGTDLVIEKGQYVLVSMMGLHYDPNNYPDPYRFDPERFSDDRDINWNGIVYAPFGQGPRMCIGDRFGLLSMKVAICHLLKNFVIEKTNETPSPITFEIKTILVQSNVGLPVRIKPFVPNKD